MNILVTGGAGYIGSHTIVELIAKNHSVHIVDNFSNSSPEAVRRIEEITGAAIPVSSFDVQDKVKLSELFNQHAFDAVIHFAGLKAVGESTADPLLYYRNNVVSSIALLEVMKEHRVKKLVFSSSATVYGAAPIPYIETYPAGQGITNPYGQTKYVIEEIMRDTAKADPSNEFTVLRYFNPIGAHPSGKIGEHPDGIPNNLMPFITQVATKKRDKLMIFGNDYDTIDGTGVRDYIHVVDLAKGHVAALEHSKPGTATYNLGTGEGTSVLELVHAFEKASGVTIPYEIAPRRPGDLPEYYADASKALEELGWRTSKTIEDACADSWRWQSQNPEGYVTHG
ncbi:MAG: UDP-glucose 4-epimerase GalE [Candidatus Saccharibacteria bacterium]|nr:MAG: UDP-glucose 4-epimerase GalE [Candidatus Saccharibacteria bacterium]